MLLSQVWEWFFIKIVSFTATSYKIYNYILSQRVLYFYTDLQLAHEEYINNAISDQQQFMREQKRSIVQSSIDRDRYHRIGDDPCTSGVSMWSSEFRPDSGLGLDRDQNYANKNDSSVIPLNSLIKKPLFVWYAAYDSEMKQDKFESLIFQWENRTIPVNQISIKLENFDVVFSKMDQAPCMIYLQQKTLASWFIKLYLLNKEQLIGLSKLKNREFWPAYNDYHMLDTSLVDNDHSVVINRWLPYDYLLRIGEYENYPIYTLTNSKVQQMKDIRNTCNPTDEYIKGLFKGMTESFPNFSQDFLLYYLNSKKGLFGKLSVPLMAELRQFGRSTQV